MAQTTPVNTVGSLGEVIIENLAITSTDAYADGTMTTIDASKLTEGKITIQNSHASNGITFAVFASIENTSDGLVPARANTSWQKIIADVALTALDSNGLTDRANVVWTEAWKWIRVDVKATSAGNQGTANVRGRGVNN